MLLLSPLWGGVFGSPLGDTYKHVWSFWHTLETFRMGWPWTTYLSFPHGGVLFDVMLAPSLLFLPITFLLGASLSSQLFVLLSFWAVGCSVFALSRHLNMSSFLALGAGVLAQTSPYLLGYPLASGVYERLAVWVFPLVWLFLLQYRQHKQKKKLVFALFSILFVAFSCQTYAVFVMMMLGFGFLFFQDRPTAIFIGVLGVCLLLSFLYIRVLQQSLWTLAPQPMRMSLLPTGPLLEESASLKAMFWPWYSRADTGVESGDWLMRIHYVGWAPLLLCVLGYRHIPKSIFFLFISFAILALGTEIMDGVPNIPYWILAYLVPVYGSIPDTFQHIALVMPFLAVATMFSLSSYKTYTQIALLLLILGERAYALPHDVLWQNASTEIPDVYHHVQEGAIVEIPRQWRGRQLVSAQPFLYQQQHKQPLAISIYMGVTGWDAYAPIALGVSENWKETMHCLRKGGIRWMMIHTEWYVSTQMALQEIAKIPLQPSFQDEERYLYDLSSLSSTPINDVFLPPRNTLVQPDSMFREEIPLELDIFSMVQHKCPIDSAAQHHQEL